MVVVTKLKWADLRPASKQIHRETLKKVLNFLKGMPLSYKVIDRSHLKRKIKADLILAVGGDGTVLAASHFTKDAPILGINSAPKTSIGFFCKATPRNFPKILRKILSGKIRPKSVARLEVRVNGKKFPYPGLNDLLLASRLQGDTARYRLRIGKLEEEQKSSGIWIATGAGSTAVIRSAGGKKDSPFTKRLQYLVREPFGYPKRHYQLLHGFLKPQESLTLISEMHQGMIFIDGAKLHLRVPPKARIVVRGGIKPLNIFL